MNPVTLYGTDSCADTQAMFYRLDSLGVQYDYLDVEKHPEAARWVQEHNMGQSKLPALSIGHEVLIDPDDPTLERVLQRTGAMG